ncbi:unnamed protein product [Rotaria socialis]
MNLCRVPLNLSPSAIWARNGITVAGIGNGTSGDTLNNLSFNYSIYMTHENVLYVTDMDNSRIVLTGPNSKTAIAVIPDDSNCSSPVSGPVDVFVTENYVYVGEMTNFHVVRFFKNRTQPITVAVITGVGRPGETTAAIGSFHNLFVEVNENLYVSASTNNRVVRYLSNSSNGTSGMIVA